MSDGIHAAIEIRRAMPGSSGGWWLAADNVYVDEPRNRLLFTSLTGKQTVLGVQPVPARGLPGDVTAEVKAALDDWGTVATDVSWVTYSELVTAIQRVWASINTASASEREKEQFAANQIGPSIQAGLSYLSAFEVHGFEARLIFWITSI